MDSFRFDHLARGLARAMDRRTVLVGVVFRALAGPVLITAAQPEAARCKTGRTRCRVDRRGSGPARTKCVNVQRNPRHCGQCRHACPRGHACAGGRCVERARCPGGCRDANGTGLPCVSGTSRTACGADGGACRRCKPNAVCCHGCRKRKPIVDACFVARNAPGFLTDGDGRMLCAASDAGRCSCLGVYRACAPGTICRQMGDRILCDYPA